MREKGEEAVKYLWFLFLPLPVFCCSSIQSFMQVKGSFNNSCFLQYPMCCAKETIITLPGSLGGGGGRLMWRSCSKNPCGDWGGCRAHFARATLRGCLLLPECSREGPSITKSCLWFSSRLVDCGILLETATEACAWPRNKPVVREAFSSVWSTLG